MEIVQCEYYREQSSNHLYKAIGNQPLPDEYRDKEKEKQIRNRFKNIHENCYLDINKMKENSINHVDQSKKIKKVIVSYKKMI